jgi:bacterioferritin-associated ferredoxin
MNLDDEVCLCFHVTKRKLVNYLRIEKVARASQLSECGGAGTGCGWCRAYLERLFAQRSDSVPADDPTPSDYAAHRANYIRAGHGTPPAGALPID